MRSHSGEESRKGYALHVKDYYLCVNVLYMCSCDEAVQLAGGSSGRNGPVWPPRGELLEQMVGWVKDLIENTSEAPQRFKVLPSPPPAAQQTHHLTDSVERNSCTEPKNQNQISNSIIITTDVLYIHRPVFC